MGRVQESGIAYKIADTYLKASQYKVQEQPLGTQRLVRVVIVGAGVNGLNTLYTLLKQAENIDCIIYEKNPECGGTWFENR